MRTFIIRARKGSTDWKRVKNSIGPPFHLEVVAHTVINAFFISSQFRANVEVYIILDSAQDFPKTILLSGPEGLSLPGFHEQAVLDVIELALKNSTDLKKDCLQSIAPGVKVYGFGFEKLVKTLLQTRTVYLLAPKGESIKTATINENPVFVLSDHLAMPKKSIQGLMRHGLETISLGKQMLFAAQCVTILHYELDDHNQI